MKKANDEDVDAYKGNEDLKWILEHNHITSTEDLAILEGRKVEDVKLWHEGYKTLKELFYDIQ